VVDSFHVLPVHRQRAHTESQRPLREIGDGRVLRERCRLGPAVVLTKEDNGQLPELSHVHRLVKEARAGGAVAEKGERDAGLGAQRERKRDAGGNAERAAHDRARTEVPALDVVKVHRATPPSRAALGLAIELGHDRPGRRALGERVRVRAVGRGDHVAGRERGAGADCHGLLADCDVNKAGDLAVPVALLDLLLELPDQEHLLQEASELAGLRGGHEIKLGHNFLLVILGVSTCGHAGRNGEEWNRIQQLTIYPRAEPGKHS